MSLSVDWVLLFLRLLFVVVLYFFLYQIVRLTTRELMLLTDQDATRPPARRPSGRLVVLDAAESSIPEGATLHLMPYTTVGRHPDCTIVLDDSFVSSEHASLELAGDRWYLRDLGSTNGTFVNGRAIETAAALTDGDVVQFGRLKVEFVC